MIAAIDGSAIVIPPTRLPDGSTSADTRVDLTDYQGRMVRLYLAANGAAQVNADGDTYWQVSEARLPPVAYESVPDDPMSRGPAVPLDLAQVDVIFYPLPE